jgi:hypothetical protein
MSMKLVHIGTLPTYFVAPAQAGAHWSAAR